MVDTSSDGTTATATFAPRLAYYMPTGEQVNFCAHAAMGGIFWQMTKQQEQWQQVASSQTSSDEEQATQCTFTSAMTGQTNTATLHDGDIISLQFHRQPWSVSKVPAPSLHRLLREVCQVDAASLVKPALGDNLPTFLNYSTARPKTLVYLNSVQALHEARAPSPRQAEHFQRACDAALDSTTGLYLYAAVPDEPDAWECRQFPRASAYPEDPATGIAASALAVALRHQSGTMSTERQVPSHYKFYQGTAMGRPSVIVVEDLQFHDKDKDGSTEVQEVSFRLLGQVQIDQQDEIEMEDNDS